MPCIHSSTSEDPNNLGLYSTVVFTIKNKITYKWTYTVQIRVVQVNFIPILYIYICIYILTLICINIYVYTHIISLNNLGFINLA